MANVENLSLEEQLELKNQRIAELEQIVGKQKSEIEKYNAAINITTEKIKKLSERQNAIEIELNRYKDMMDGAMEIIRSNNSIDSKST